MPVTYQIADAVLTFTTVGDVDYADGLAVLTDGLSRYADSQPAIPRVLFDLTLSTEDRSSDELQGIAQLVSRRLPRARIALVVRSSLHFGLARVFAAFADEDASAINVFRDMAQAQAWLKAR